LQIAKNIAFFQNIHWLDWYDFVLHIKYSSN
jgi:hypothetical protein